MSPSRRRRPQRIRDTPVRGMAAQLRRSSNPQKSNAPYLLYFGYPIVELKRLNDVTAISLRSRALSSLSPIIIDFINQAGNFFYPLGKKGLGRRKRQPSPGHRIPSRSGKAAEPVEGGKVGTEDMIGRQHRGEGADLMRCARCDAFDIEDCFRKLFRRLLQMKGSVSRVPGGDEPGEIKVLASEKDEAFGPVAHALDLPPCRSRAR